MPPTPLPQPPTPPADLVRRYIGLLSAAGVSSLRALLPIHARSLLTIHARALHRVLDAAPHREAYLWNTLLRAHAHSHSSVPAPSPAADALQRIQRMRAAGVAPDCYTYPIVLPACAAAGGCRAGAAVRVVRGARGGAWWAGLLLGCTVLGCGWAAR